MLVHILDELLISTINCYEKLVIVKPVPVVLAMGYSLAQSEITSKVMA